MTKNTLLILAGRGANAIFVFILTLAVSRGLGPDGFGVFSFIITVVFTSLHLAHFGLDTWLFREVSWHPDQGRQQLARALSLKSVTSFATIGLIAVVFHLLPLPSETYRGLMLLSGSILFVSLSQLLWFFADGYSRFEYHVGLWAGSNALKALAGGAIALGFQNLNLILLGLLLVDAAILVLSWIMISRWTPLPKPQWEPLAGWQLLKKVLPLALVTFLAALCFRFPIVFLTLIKTDREVGWFSAAFRLVELYTLIPQSIFLVLFPILARLSKTSMGEIRSQAWRTGGWLTLLGLGAGAVTFFLAPYLIPFLFGEAFQNSVPLLRGLSALLLFISWNYLLSHLLLSLGKERANLWILATVTLAAIVLNGALITHYGPMGAVGASLATEFLYTVLLAIAVRSVFLKEPSPHATDS